MKQLRPCEVELGYCCLIERWAGCWEKGHEPHDRDQRKCPATVAEADLLYERSCDAIIKRSRRNARRTAKTMRRSDGR